MKSPSSPWPAPKSRVAAKSEAMMSVSRFMSSSYTMYVRRGRFLSQRSSSAPARPAFGAAEDVNMLAPGFLEHSRDDVAVGRDCPGTCRAGSRMLIVRGMAIRAPEEMREIIVNLPARGLRCRGSRRDGRVRRAREDDAVDRLAAPEHRPAERTRLEHFEVVARLLRHAVGEQPVVALPESYERENERDDHNGHEDQDDTFHIRIVLELGVALNWKHYPAAERTDTLARWPVSTWSQRRSETSPTSLFERSRYSRTSI